MAEKELSLWVALLNSRIAIQKSQVVKRLAHSRTEEMSVRWEHCEQDEEGHGMSQEHLHVTPNQ